MTQIGEESPKSPFKKSTLRGGDVTGGGFGMTARSTNK